MPVAPAVVLEAPVPGVTVMPERGSRLALLLVNTNFTCDGLLSRSTIVNGMAGSVLPDGTAMSVIELTNGAFPICSGTTCVTVPLVAPTVHGVDIVSVSLVALGFATSSKS